MPSSRTATVVIASDVKQALTIEKATIAGVIESGRGQPAGLDLVTEDGLEDEP